MFDRAKAVHENFLSRVKNEDLPRAQIYSTHLSREQIIDLFESQIMSRQLDLISRTLRAKNESFYTIGSSGHEGNAVLGMVFPYTDMAFLHYRSCAFMIQRSKQFSGSTPLYDHLLSFTASKEDPISGGRHKVLGSKNLFVPPQTSTIASHLPKAVGAAFSITKKGTILSQDSTVLCSFGDGSANHSTAQGAFHAAEWFTYQDVPLPLVFICEDNGLAISVPTPKNWIESTFSNRNGLKYFSCDGLNILDVYRVTVEVQKYVQKTQRPAFLHIKTVRLMGHAGSDIETTYRTLKEMEQTESHDPLLYTASIIRQLNYLSSDEILKSYQEIGDRLERIASICIQRPKLKNISEVKESLVPYQKIRHVPAAPQKNLSGKHPLGKLINQTLKDLLIQYPQVLVFGEDVAKKGGVYHVTADLQKHFGETRVFDTLLDEQTILGLAMGLGHNGFVAIPEIQFLAYVHNAEDQIRGEAATLSFFSNGQFVNPFVLRVPGLAYQKGFGGHFHNDNSLNVFRDIPGIIVACPSRGDDAAMMLRTCVREAYEYGRVVIFVEPIALYMTRDLLQEKDEGWSFEYPDFSETIEVGEVGIHGESQELTIITYGNGTYLSMQAKEELQVPIRIIDLRWICPLPEKKIIEEVKKAKRILIVDECRKNGSTAEGISRLILEKCEKIPPMKIITAEDCFISLGNASTLGLPNKKIIMEACEELLSL